MPGAFEILHKIAIHSLSDNYRNNYFTGLLFFPVKSPDYYCMFFQRSGENGFKFLYILFDQRCPLLFSPLPPFKFLYILFDPSGFVQQSLNIAVV